MSSADGAKNKSKSYSLNLYLFYLLMFAFSETSFFLHNLYKGMFCLKYRHCEMWFRFGIRKCPKCQSVKVSIVSHLFSVYVCFLLLQSLLFCLVCLLISILKKKAFYLKRFISNWILYFGTMKVPKCQSVNSATLLFMFVCFFCCFCCVCSVSLFLLLFL